jgi:hypothetical protein
VLAFGLDPESNVDGFNPGADVYELNEARRQNLISRQLELNYQMLWLSGHAGVWGGEPPVRQPIGHESIQVSPNKWIYRPLYAEDVKLNNQQRTAPENLPAPAPRTQPQVQPQKQPAANAPQAPGPIDAKPGDRMPPKPETKKVPRPRVF